MKKTCTRCKTEYEATLENFAPVKSGKYGLDSQCRACKREYYADNKAEMRNQQSEYRPKYYASVRGNLREKFRSMNRRCSKHETYLAKGIKNKFKNFEHFRSYVVGVLGVDPRGLICHRIDNDGHYEVGNIAFMTMAEHTRLHAKK
jgi:hypothetical protein